MLLYSLFIGLEKDGNGKALDQLKAVDAIKDMKLDAARLFGGYTVSAVTGGWVNEQGTMMEEAAMRFDIMAGGQEVVVNFASSMPPPSSSLAS